MNSAKHGFAYGRSRVGKTTLAAHYVRAGHKLLIVTLEPGPAAAALAAAGVEARIWTPANMDELMVFIDYNAAYVAKHFPDPPTAILFDNLQGLQQLLIGSPGVPEREVAGIKIPAIPTSGVLQIPKSSKDKTDIQNPEALGQQHYGVLGRYTRRLMMGIDALPYHTLITSTEQYDFDEKYKKDTEGMDTRMKTGRPRKVKGYPAMEGSMLKGPLPSLVANFYVHLTHEGGKYLMHTVTHTDKDQVEWFADTRGVAAKLPPVVDWTNKSGYDLLVGGTA